MITLFTLLQMVKCVFVSEIVVQHNVDMGTQEGGQDARRDALWSARQYEKETYH